MRFSICFCIFWVIVEYGATAAALEVSRIEVSGHKRTKEFTILRELDFAVGDTIAIHELSRRLERNRSNLLNTALFTEVEVNIKNWDHSARRIVVSVVVREALYIYVIPIIELADRNFNVWWQEHNRAFNRLNLGVSVQHINFTGVKDRLKAKGHLGYTQKFEADYVLPHFDRGKSIGLLVNVFWSSNKEVAYRTQEDKQLFYKDDHTPVFERLRFTAGLRYRPNLYTTHVIEASFHSNRIDPRIAHDNNPDFFLNQKSRQNYFSLRYKGVYDGGDLQLFPMKGWLGGIEIIKEGLGPDDDMNALSMLPFIEYHVPLSQGISLSVATKVQYGLIRKKQPFWNYQGLGYGREYIRGYELYVVNGLDYIYGKGSLKARILDSQINWKRIMPRVFREMPYQLYLTMNYDIGYVNDPFYAEGNNLINRSISGGGPGLVVLLYYTFGLHLEYNFNQLGESGVFLHSKTAF